jgi:hypothetical protein
MQHRNQLQKSLRIFLGNHQEENYHVMVDDLVESYKSMGCIMFFLGACPRLS